MESKFGKMKSFVDSLDLSEVEESEQALLLTGHDAMGGSGSNSYCYNYSSCSGSSNGGCHNSFGC